MAESDKVVIPECVVTAAVVALSKYQSSTAEYRLVRIIELEC